ncbi:hypothetical protein PtA15_5A415 [Puccinia triticina]|uniref:Uncharacterized protein n=1 Tax=Puccinia triticina TaxID=208348 RepID=A0ABY7CLH2_9BASI|nr:uncharacterized protein PtA15_5A415 [Puccinia triticina]WAQ84842.1 hypothetical protein PtA15_5A415 [Puccinia triticina]
MFQVITPSTCFNPARLIRSSSSSTKLIFADGQPRNLSCYSFKLTQRRPGSGQAGLMPSQAKVNNTSASSAWSPAIDLSASSRGSKNESHYFLTADSESMGEGQGGIVEAGPSTQIDTDLLLKELKSLQENAGRASKSSIHKRVKHHWEQWNEFLKTPKGKILDSDVILRITHEFLFLHPSKILTIFEDNEQAQRSQEVSPSTRFDQRIFKSIGFATLKYQNWTVLKRLLSRQRNLRRSDVLSIVRIASRKILFSSSLKTQNARITAILGLSGAITDTFNEETDCIKCMTQSVEILCDALLRMSCHEPAAAMILQILRRHPNFAKYFTSHFLHRLMSTCASHQYLSTAHDLLAELPPELQTLDQFKACMSVWDRRTPRPLLHSACSVWHALVSHPHIVPDHDAHNLYLALKSRLGHVEDLMRIIHNMERRGILEEDGKQKTYGILLHSIGRRRGIQSAYEVLPELVSRGYIPDEHTSNILLSAKPIDNPDSNLSYSRNESANRAGREERLLETMQQIKKANMKSDEVTRNILVRSFLSRSPYHSKEAISNIKHISLDQSGSNLEPNLDRKQFRRFRKPLYSMLCSAFRRANYLDELEDLKLEWKRESSKARSKSARNPQKS